MVIRLHGRSVLLWLLLAGASLAASAQAQGQPPPAAAASEYESALSQALQAHARGEYETARLFMERAHAIEPTARTLRGLGIVAFAQKRQLEAIRYLDAALASKVKSLPDDLRKSAEELRAQAWAQVARLEVVVDAEGGDFLIDGQAPDFYATHTIVLPVGAHVLTARAKQRAPYELHLDAHAGERRTLNIVLAVPPPPERVEKIVARSLAPETPEKPAFYTPTVRGIGLGSGALLLASGAVLWATAYARLQAVDAGCREMKPAGCTPTQAQHRFDKQGVGALSVTGIVLMGVGAAALATVAGLELWRWRQRRRDVDVRLGLGQAFVSGYF